MSRHKIKEKSFFGKCDKCGTPLSVEFIETGTVVSCKTCNNKKQENEK